MISPAVREAGVIALLEEWPWEFRTTLIGGYALAAYGAARYSDDLDFVVPAESGPRIEAWLRAREFAEARGTRARSRQTFHGATRMSRAEITVDLLQGFVRDREAGVDVPEAWISLRPCRTPLDLLGGRVGKPVVAARPEALWALKLQAGRDQDLTDLFALLREPVKVPEVRALFESLNCETLGRKLTKVEERLGSPKLYVDTRSRLGLKDTLSTRTAWQRFRSRVHEMMPPRQPGPGESAG